METLMSTLVRAIPCHECGSTTHIAHILPGNQRRCINSKDCRTRKEAIGHGFSLEEVPYGEALAAIPAIDLTKEIASLDALRLTFECYFITQQNKAEGGVLLYVPECKRAGIAWGGPAEWTDCTSADDAVRRFLTGEMID
jgi:hypothetical protein